MPKKEAPERPPKKAPPTGNRTILMSDCGIAQFQQKQVVQSGRSPGWWHDHCKGGHVNERGQITLCECGCHEAKPFCIDCGSNRSELDDWRRCIDREGCLENLKQAIEANPRTAKYREIDRLAAAARAESREAAGLEPVKEAKPAKVPQPCGHCGELTKGGQFLAGHDAKLKGILARAGADGGVGAVVELKLRCWFKPSPRYDSQLLEDADRLVQELNTEAELARLVQERVELIRSGYEPEAAVRFMEDLK